MYNLTFSNSAGNFLKKIERVILIRITEKLEKLKINPFPADCKRVEIKGKVFRIRVGDFRILYEVLHQDSKLYIIKIDKRGRVYKN